MRRALDASVQPTQQVTMRLTPAVTGAACLTELEQSAPFQQCPRRLRAADQRLGQRWAPR